MGVILFLTILTASCYEALKRGGEQFYEDWSFILKIYSFVILFAALQAPPHRDVKWELPPVPNIAEALGCAYPWRCCPSHHKHQPKHYYLIRKIQKQRQHSLEVECKIQIQEHKSQEYCKDKKPKVDMRIPHHWHHQTSNERMEDWDQIKHKYLHQSFFQFDIKLGINLDTFSQSINPLKQFHQLRQLSINPFFSRSKNTHLNQDLYSNAKIEATKLKSLLYSSIARNDLLIQDPFNSDSAESSVQDQRVYVSVKKDKTMPIVIDTGASISLTPNRDDFIGPIRPIQAELKGLADHVSVAGVGQVEWTIRDLFGAIRIIRTQAYLVPSASIRLFSPQVYFREQKGAGRLIVTAAKTTLELTDATILEFPYQDNMLPMMLTGDCLKAGLTFQDAIHLSSPNIGTTLSVAAENNQNLTVAEKELLLHHFQLGHANIRWIQSLLAHPQDGSLPILPSKNKGASTTTRQIICAACAMGKQHARTAKPSRKITNPQEMAIRQGNLQPGDAVSVDQYLSSVPGRLSHTKGKEPTSQQYQGGTIFVDHASSVVYIANQVSLRAGESTQAKHKFEQWACHHNVPKIRSYRADNFPFNASKFHEDLQANGQTITFSGVGAHHQNGVAERAISTCSSWARTIMLHQVLHWPQHADLKLWPFALEHAVHIWNHLPRPDSRLSPIEIFTGSKAPTHESLSRLHVWGCPTYVLDPKLQDGKKLPKWKPRSRLGMYLGLSPSHSSTVSRILNLSTGHVSPQYHIVCDDHFSSVSTDTSTPDHFTPERWAKLIETGYEMHLDVLEESDHHQLPSLSDDWLTIPERKLRQCRRAAIEARRRLLQSVPHCNDLHQGNHDSEGGEIAEAKADDEEKENAKDESWLPQIEDPFHLPTSNSNESFSHDKDHLEIDDLSVPEGDDDDDFQTALQDPLSESDSIQSEPKEKKQNQETKLQNCDSEENPNSQGCTRSGRRFRPRPPLDNSWLARLSSQKGMRYGLINRQFLSSLKWNQLVMTLQSDEFASMWNMVQKEIDHDYETYEWIHPMILAAKANSEDTPTWEEAMNGPLADGYMEAAEKEIRTLQDMQVWDVVDRKPWMNVLPSTWAFRCKRFPSGLVRKLKARFCCRGDRQIDGIDFDSNDIFSPVINWNTVRLMLILSLILGLETKQVDYTAAFVHAPIGNKEVYCQMPRGFSQPGKVLKLKKSLYGLRQSPINFFRFIKSKLEGIGFHANDDVDPCLFISDKVICLVYVDDTLFFSPKQEFIDEAIQGLRDAGVQVEVEDDVAGFLGVHIKRDNSQGTITLTQEGLTKRIVEALDISDKPIKHTPAVRQPLVKDPNGDPPDGRYSYASVIGMMLYLSGHSRPDIQYAVSQCARFIHGTKQSHEEALERIGQYLKGTMEKGLILKPTSNMDFECYCDADFAGLYAFEDISDPSCVKSRTGYVICVAGCPVSWTSRLQQDVALSTMEAEYNSLSMAMKDVLPMQTLFKSVGKGIGLEEFITSSFKTTVWEDNMGCLKLANMQVGQYTPRSKHYAVKYHWFRSKLQETRTTIKYIESNQQKADILTKGLTTDTFRVIRKLLCGW